MTDPQPYVELALAVIVQTLADAHATSTTTVSNSILPTPADVADARATLPILPDLAQMFGLDPDYVRRLLNQTHHDATEPYTEREWMTPAEIAANFGYNRERVRQLIRAGKISARKGVNGWGWRVDPQSVEAYKQSLEPC
jgi:hypothetical protein